MYEFQNIDRAAVFEHMACGRQELLTMNDNSTVPYMGYRGFGAQRTSGAMWAEPFACIAAAQDRTVLEHIYYWY